MLRSLRGPCARFCFCLALTMGASASTRAQLVINEFLADPAGSDGGHEFVELLNTGTIPIDLGSWQLQFANGAEGADWQTRWSGLPGRVVPAGGRFLIVDRNWPGPAAGDAEAALALQNGPDALRLARDGQAADVVGYGALTDPLLMEGSPAPIAVDRSTSRRPDGRDTDDNAADFVTAAPTPGLPNFRRHQLTVVESFLDPPSVARAGDALSVGAVVRNDGIDTLATARLRLTCGAVTGEAMLDVLRPSGERRIDWTLRPAADGRWPLRIEYALPDGADTLRADLGQVQVGPAELGLGEVMAAPRAGQGEWIELTVADTADVSLDGYRLRDADGGWVALPAIVVPAHGLAVVVQDSAAFADWLSANEGGPAAVRGCGAPVIPLGPWPSLNNDVPESRAWADRVLVADISGTVIDHVTIGDEGQDVPDGRSLERIVARPAAGQGANWAVSLAAAGSTPGCPNSVAGPSTPPSAGGELQATPTVADRSETAAIHLRFNVPAGSDGWDLVIYDLDGRAARDLGGDRLGEGPREIFWDLRDEAGLPVPSGGYVACLRFVPDQDAGRRTLLVVR